MCVCVHVCVCVCVWAKYVNMYVLSECPQYCRVLKYACTQAVSHIHYVMYMVANTFTHTYVGTVISQGFVFADFASDFRFMHS